MHTVRDKRKLLNRVRRIRGQVEAIERALTAEDAGDCARILQTVAACRGALNGLMAEIIEGHVREHVLKGSRASKEQTAAAEDLLDVVRAYLK